MDTILVERSGPIATVTLNRPSVLNALNLRMLDELEQTFAELDADAELACGDPHRRRRQSVRRRAPTSASSTRCPARTRARSRRAKGQALTRAIERLRVPVIAAVNGFALGGGCELAMACDIRVASENAKFGQPEVNLGILPGYGGTQRMTRLVGEGTAMYLCLTGEMLDANEALRVGLVQKVVPLDGLLAEAQRIAGLIAAKAPLAIAATKRAIVDGASLALDDALALEALLFGQAITTEDFREGSQAFLDKRKADFTGR